MAQTPEVIRGAQASRASAYDSHPLAGLRGQGRDNMPSGVKLIVSGEPLEMIDIDRFLNQAAPALAFARMRADPAASQRQGIALFDFPDCIFVPALGDEPYVSRDIDLGRACGLARSQTLRIIV